MKHFRLILIFLCVGLSVPSFSQNPTGYLRRMLKQDRNLVATRADSYAEMLTLKADGMPKQFVVENDEHTGLSKTTYFWDGFELKLISPVLSENGNSIDKVDIRAAKSTPFVSIKELRAGKADTASVVNVNENNQSGTFQYNPTSSRADDSVMTIKVGNKAYDRIVDAHINLKWFGAKGDGVTDNTPIFKKALDYLNSIGGGELFIPAGTYITGRINPGKRTSIRGIGINSSVIKLKANTADTTLLDMTGWYEATVSELTLSGNKANNSTVTNGILLNKAVGDGNSNYRSLIFNVFVTEFTGSGVKAIYGSWVFTVMNCTFRNNNKHGIENYSTDNGFYNNNIALNGLCGIFNKGNNTRYSLGKILFNGWANEKGAVATTAGIWDISTRSTYSNIEVQENFRHGFAAVGASYIRAENILADGNNVALRANVLGNTSWNDPASVGYGIYLAGNDFYITGSTTDLKSIASGERSQYPMFISETSNRIRFCIVNEPDQMGPVILPSDPSRYTNTCSADVTGISGDLDYSVKLKGNIGFLFPITANRTVSLPTDGSVQDVLLYNTNNSAFNWVTDVSFRTNTTATTNQIPNQATIRLRFIGGTWRQISLFKGDFYSKSESDANYASLTEFNNRAFQARDDSSVDLNLRILPGSGRAATGTANAPTSGDGIVTNLTGRSASQIVHQIWASITGKLMFQRYMASSGTWTTWRNISKQSKVRLTSTTGTIGSIDETILVDATSGNKVMTFPSSSSSFEVDYGQTFTIKKVDASANTVTASATIDGVSGYVLRNQFESITFQADGTEFKVIGYYNPNAVQTTVKTGTGNGTTTVNIAHGLSFTPKIVSLPNANNAASVGLSYVTADATNFILTFSVAPANAASLSFNISYTK